MSGAAVGVLALAAGQNVLDPHSPAEHRITMLGWIMFVGCAIGLAFVAVLLVMGWARRRRDALPFGGGEKAGTGLVIGLGIGVPIVVLTALFVYSNIFVIRSTAAPNPRTTSLTVQVIGHQFWWEIRYPGTKAVTANELHIPTRTRVNIVGTTADVIHSFWVPELNRKIDLIPGHASRVLFYANRAGEYRGKCAEFCGLQHAHMDVIVFAQPRPQFEAWLRAQAAPARATGMPGEAVFDDNACANCHQIRGTPAHGQVGPDLTHLASRTTLAAGTIANTRPQLEEWVRDPQHPKPGNKMPQVQVPSQEFKPLIDYLEALK
jgi:cytochrome c oxidase subunit II